MNYTCNIERATQSKFAQPGICHVQCLGYQDNDFEHWLEVGFRIIESNVPDNAGKETTTRLFQMYEGEPQASFDRALMNITIALGIKPKEYFEKCAKKGVNPEIDVDDWKGRQCGIVISKKKNSNFTIIASFFPLESADEEGCPVNKEIQKEINSYLARGEHAPIIGDEED